MKSFDQLTKTKHVNAEIICCIHNAKSEPVTINSLADFTAMINPLGIVSHGEKKETQKAAK